MTAFLEIGIILALAAGVALVMQYFRLPLLLGHVLTGVLVGPLVFNLLQTQDTLEIFSRFGITALLFIVGLGLSPLVLREVGKPAVVAGVGQIIFTVLFGFLLAHAFGYSSSVAFLLALALTFSSTIVVMKLLSERGELHRLSGKISIGFLLVQDLIATACVIFLSSADSSRPWETTLLVVVAKLIFALAALYAASRFLLPRLLRLFAASQEFLFLFSIGWGLGLSALFQLLGLSIEIGALAAGIALATSPYRYEITAKMRLLRDFFLVMFFVLLGSQLQWQNIERLWPQALAFSLFVLIANPLIMLAILGRLGYAKKTAFLAGLTVAQIGEFSLILTLLATNKGYLPPEMLPLVTLTGLITMTVSSLVILRADAIFSRLAPLLTIFERAHPIMEHARQERFQAVLFGCHRVGGDFIHTLKNLNTSYLVVDFDPAVIERLETEGIACRYGDAFDNDFVEELNLRHAKLIVSTIPDFETNMFLLQKIKKLKVSSLLILSAQSLEQAHLLYRAGADYVITPHFLGGNHTAMLLEKHGCNKSKFSHERRQHLAHLKNR